MSVEVAVLRPPDWQRLQAQHEDRVRPWVEPRLERRHLGLRHPVDDFLFEYYRYRPGQLLAWHPGWRVAVEGCARLAADANYVTSGPVSRVSAAAPAPRIGRIDRAIAVLTGTQSRAATFSCFGMHEWAMVYRIPASRVRHGDVPLRFTEDVLADVVDDVGLRCSHFDAYRFFSAAAATKQRPLSRARQPDDEQPGCLHAGMDLYRYAYEAAPWIASTLVADAFELARSARELDMRASPYDLSAWGIDPVRVETPEGRREYATAQRDLASAAARLRTRLLQELQILREWVGSPLSLAHQRP